MLIYITVCIITFGFTTFLTIAGLGAAFILIPVLLALGIPLLTAMSTALLLNSIAMVIASINYMKEKLIVFKTAIPIAIAALAFSPLGAKMAEYLPENILKWIFVGFLLFAATMIIFYKPKERQQKDGTIEMRHKVPATEIQHENGAGLETTSNEVYDPSGKVSSDDISAVETSLQAYAEQKADEARTAAGAHADAAAEAAAAQAAELAAQGYASAESTNKLIGYGIIVGTVAGFFGGLLGVGGGNFIVPFLMFLGFNAKNAAATTAFIVIFSSLSGFLTHARMGNINLWLLLFCVIGSISGAILGSYLMKKKLTAGQVKIAIGIVLYIVAAKMIFDLLTSVLAAA